MKNDTIINYKNNWEKYKKSKMTFIQYLTRKHSNTLKSIERIINNPLKDFEGYFEEIGVGVGINHLNYQKERKEYWIAQISLVEKLENKNRQIKEYIKNI